MSRLKHHFLCATITAIFAVAPQARADSPCASASASMSDGFASSPDGVWTATSQYGGVYKIRVQSSASPPFEIVDGKPADQDSVAVDNAPSPDEIALGALTGQPVRAWTAFANDQAHPQMESKLCPPLLVARTFYSIAPPAGAPGVYIRQMITTFNFGEDPPVMTETYDFWPPSRPEKMVRFSLSPESRIAGMWQSGGAGAGTCSSPSDCVQTPGFGVVIALAGSFLGLLGGAFAEQLGDVTSAVGQALADTFRPVTDAQNRLAELVANDPIEMAHLASEVASHVVEEAGAAAEVISALEVANLALGPVAIATLTPETPTVSYFPAPTIDPVLFTDVSPFPGETTVQAPGDSGPFETAPSSPQIVDPAGGDSASMQSAFSPGDSE